MKLKIQVGTRSGVELYNQISHPVNFILSIIVIIVALSCLLQYYWLRDFFHHRKRLVNMVTPLFHLNLQQLIRTSSPMVRSFSMRPRYLSSLPLLVHF